MTDHEAQHIILDMVLTVREVCALFGRSQKSVMMDIYKERIAGRQAQRGKIWLITRASCIQHYGQPKEEDDNGKLE